MNARQQLAKIEAARVKVIEARESGFSCMYGVQDDVKNDALNWIASFATAVCELVEADAALDRWTNNQQAWMRGDGDRYRIERAIADSARGKRAAALAVLTKDTP